MTYTITTKTPCDTEEPVPVDSRAVATLDEARRTVTAHIERESIGSRENWADAHYAAQTLPEDGGTVGPLPDGTVIEVYPA